MDLLHYTYGGLLERNPDKSLIKHKVHPVIIKYLVNIVEKYTNKNEFNFQRYYNEVYLPNLDLWGMVTCTLSIFDLLLSNIKLLNSLEKDVLEVIEDLFQHILECDTRKIAHEKIVNSFQKIAELYTVQRSEPLQINKSSKRTRTTITNKKKLSTKKVSSKTIRRSLTNYKSISYKHKTRKKYF